MQIKVSLVPRRQRFLDIFEQCWQRQTLWLLLTFEFFPIISHFISLFYQEIYVTNKFNCLRLFKYFFPFYTAMDPTVRLKMIW
jgi:hypothetical protein